MRKPITLGLALALLVFLGCGVENPSPTSASVVQEMPGLAQQSSASLEAPTAANGLPQGACPDIYFESTETLSNGVTLTWTSSFGGFDYNMRDDYPVTVTWSVDSGVATFMDFVDKSNVWTPKDKKNRPGKGVDGSWDFDGSTLTVTMTKMHRVEEDDWLGYMGNGHFKLELLVDGVKVKLGVNVHLEDPDGSFDPRCP